jgi:hypothetical protein
MEVEFTLLSTIQNVPNLVDNIVGYGAIGVCLVALATWYIIKDQRYEKRMDERLKREEVFLDKYAELSEKYRIAMEKFSSTLDVVVNIVKSKGGGVL